MSKTLAEPSKGLARPVDWGQSAESHYAGLVLLFFIEAVAFYSQLAVRITPFYPSSFDQTTYMVDAYKLLDAFLSRGWKEVFASILSPRGANGVIFTVQGMLLMLVGGPTRTAMLSLNLLYFIALQAVVFNTVRTRLQGIQWAWIALALLLTSVTAFNYAGGIFDYRMDFSAICLYGIWVCLIIQSEAFYELRSGLLVTAVGVWLILLRFITIVYLGAVFGGLLAAILVALWFTSTSEPVRSDYARRARNVLISGALTAALAFPILFSARQYLYDYYGIGHFFGEEKNIRAAELGIRTSFEHLVFYPMNILRFHLGWLCVWLIGALLLFSLTIALAQDRGSLARFLKRLNGRGFDLLASALAIVVPLAILTLDYSKSPVVGGIVVVPIIIFVITLSAVVWPHGWFATPDSVIMRCVTCTATACLFIVSLAAFLTNNAVDSNGMPREDRERVTHLNKQIVGLVAENQIVNPKVSVDRVVDYLNVGTLELYGYESLRRIVNFSGYFGHGGYGIFATPRETALKLITESDVVVLTDANLARTHPYPMNIKIKEYWGELWQWANENMMLVWTTNVLGIPHYIFMAPLVQIGGLSGPWITSKGLSIELDAALLNRWPYVVLQGPADEHHYTAILGGVPQPRAVVDNVAGLRSELPTVFKSNGATYSIVIDAQSIATATSELRKIDLTFDRYFVPSKLGKSLDTRELVVFGPNVRKLVRQAPQ